MKVKEKTEEVLTTTKRVVTNAETFVQAAALLGTAGFSYYALPKVNLAEPVQWFITFSLVVIGLRGFYEMFKFLDKK